jgi:hypothetical protein
MILLLTHPDQRAPEDVRPVWTMTMRRGRVVLQCHACYVGSDLFVRYVLDGQPIRLRPWRDPVATTLDVVMREIPHWLRDLGFVPVLVEARI